MNDWIVELIVGGGYWGIAILMALENVVPPIPSELIMGLGGLAVERGTMGFVPLLLAGTIGAVAGNLVWFWFGHKVGYVRLRPFVERWGRWLTIEWEDIERAATFLRRRGDWVVLALRCGPFMRTMISLPAGMAGMGTARFLVFTTIGTAVWNAALIWGGMLLGRHLGDRIQHYTGPVAIALIVIGLGWYAWRVATWKPRAGRNSSGQKK